MALVTTKRWGSSIGVVLPKELVTEQGIGPNERVQVFVVKQANIKSIIGTLPTKRSAQAMKDLARKGWEK